MVMVVYTYVAIAYVEHMHALLVGVIKILGLRCGILLGLLSLKSRNDSGTFGVTAAVHAHVATVPQLGNQAARMPCLASQLLSSSSNTRGHGWPTRVTIDARLRLAHLIVVAIGIVAALQVFTTGRRGGPRLRWRSFFRQQRVA